MKLDGMSKEALTELRAEIDIQLLKLETERRENALNAVREAAESYGFSIDEITSSAGRRGNALKKGLPKYAHPSDKTKTWTGKGRKPKWFEEALGSGLAANQMEI